MWGGGKRGGGGEGIDVFMFALYGSSNASPCGLLTTFLLALFCITLLSPHEVDTHLVAVLPVFLCVEVYRFRVCISPPWCRSSTAIFDRVTTCIWRYIYFYERVRPVQRPGPSFPLEVITKLDRTKFTNKR